MIKWIDKLPAGFLFTGLIVIHLTMHWSPIQQDLTGFHVWRQSQTQINIQNFATEDFNIFNPRINDRGAGDGIYRMEFPLMQWITAIPVKLFGQHVLISRLMTFLFTILGWIGFFKWVKVLSGSRMASLFGTFLFSFSPMLYYYMINPMPDTLALTTGVWSLYYLSRWYRSDQSGSLASGLLLLMTAALVKMPYLLFYGGFATLVLFKHGMTHQHRVRLLVFGVMSSLPVVGWYLWVIPGWEGNGIVQGVFNMSSEQRGQYWYYCWFHLRTTLPELATGLPGFVTWLAGCIILIINKKRISSEIWAYLVVVLLLLLLFLFEMNMIETVHDYYFMPLLPFLFLPLVWLPRHFLNSENTKKWLIPFLLIGLLSPVYAGFRINSRWDRLGFNRDWLEDKQELREAVPNEELVVAGNDISHHIFLYYIDKKGWVFENNWINGQKLEEMIQKGCVYLYSDSRQVDEHPQIAQHLGTIVAQYGSVKVFKLKKN